MRTNSVFSVSTTTAVAVFLLFAAVLSDTAYAQANGTDSCDRELNVSAIPFDTSSLQCEDVWSDENFILRYGNQSGGWSFVLSAPDRNAYIALGFSPTGMMMGSSAVVGWVPGTGNGIAIQYNLSGKGQQLVLPNSGNLSLVGNASILSLLQRLYLFFQLDAQPSANLIYAVGPDGTFPGSDLLLDKHEAHFNSTIDYSSGGGSSGDDSPGGGSSGDDSPSGGPSGDSSSGEIVVASRVGVLAAVGVLLAVLTS